VSAPPIEAVIFDLDGVIVDSEIWWDEARHAFAADHDRQWTVADRQAVMGANSRQWSETMRQRLDLDLSAGEIERDVVDRMVDRYAREGPPEIEGAVPAVRAIAASRPTALASSSHLDVIDAALRATGLEGAFAAVVSSDEVAHGKPEPDVFLEAARRLGVAPDRTLVVEDTLNGVRAAKAATMTAVLVPNWSIPPAAGAEEEADLVLDRLSDLDVDRLPGRARAPSGDAATAEPLPAAPMTAPVAAPAQPRPQDRTMRQMTATRSSTPAVAAAMPDTINPIRRTIRTWISRLVIAAMCRGLFRLSLDGRDRLPRGPAIYCLNHRCWIDPFVALAVLPMRPRLMFFGPKEEDMSVGGRNRLMSWTGATIPYRPGKNDLLEATRKVHAAIAAGRVVVIFGEGRIQPFESHLRPLSEGAAYFALREGVPLVPAVLLGTSWVGFGRRIALRIGEPLVPEGRPGREAVDALTARCTEAMSGLLRGTQEADRPGRFGRWLTELFNDWPEGSRSASEVAEQARTTQASRERRAGTIPAEASGPISDPV
jgi:HAD superfamily hydrolase (TIGR01509 family)